MIGSRQAVQEVVNDGLFLVYNQQGQKTKAPWPFSVPISRQRFANDLNQAFLGANSGRLDVSNKWGPAIVAAGDWRSGAKDDRPYDFGNPTTESPDKILLALRQGPWPVGSTGDNEVYYSPEQLTDHTPFAFENVYNIAFVVTRGQSRNLCNNGSCIKK